MRCLFLLLFIVSTNALGSELCEPHPELKFFNTISGVLDIKLSEKAVSMDKLPGNLVSKPTSKIKGLTLNAEVYNEAGESYRQLTSVELDSKAFESSSILLGSESGESVEHSADNGKYFTVKELISAVETTELKTRGNTDWFGGIDVHHIYFEGLTCHQGTWVPYWGS